MENWIVSSVLVSMISVAAYIFGFAMGRHCRLEESKN